MGFKLGGVDSNVKKKGLVKGLILGCIVVILNILSFYYMTGTVESHPLLVLPGSFILTIVIPLITIILFTLNIRGSIGGYWSFRQAVTAIFIMLFTTYIMLTIGRDILFVKLVEPNMVQKIGAVMVESRMRKDQLDGMSSAQIIQDLAFEKKNFSVQVDNGQWAIVESIPENILITFVLAIMLAAIFKKERPFLVEKTEE
ncbi:DUF4199 domain-containing protein [Mucilaginibacter sp.]